MPLINLDCSDLDDDDLGDLTEAIGDNPAIDRVSLPFVFFDDEDDGEEDDAPLGIQASSEPLVLAVHFVASHWKVITAGTSGTMATVKAGKWLIDSLQEWSEKRKGEYDLRPIYDAENNVVSVVKVKRKL